MKKYKPICHEITAFQLNDAAREKYPELCEHIKKNGSWNVKDNGHPQHPCEGDYIITDYFTSGKLRSSFMEQHEFERMYEEA